MTQKCHNRACQTEDTFASMRAAQVYCYNGTFTDNNNQGEQIQVKLRQQTLLSGLIIYPARRYKKSMYFWAQMLQYSVNASDSMD